MAAAPPTLAELDALRAKADRFLAELLEEYYRHYAGLKPSLELEPIYSRYPEIAALETAHALSPLADRDRGARELWRFACSEYLASLTRSHSERIAGLEASLQASVDGERVAYRLLRPTMANEPDRERRRRLEEARCALADEHLAPLHEEAAGIAMAAVRELGAVDMVELHERFGFRLQELAAQARRVLEETEGVFQRELDRLFRLRLDLPLAQAARWDVPRLFRAPAWDAFFPAQGMLPALEATLADLGIDLGAQRNVELDLERRETKSPRAFCAPIEVPGRVVLVVQPIGGIDDWKALFHEAGHTEHFACTDPHLALEERRLGDNAVTEGWAALFEHLVDDQRWLGRRLGVPRAQELEREGAVELLWYLRRYCAKLLYELELYRAQDVRAMRDRYVEILGGALHVEPSPSDWLADVDPGFYVTEYLRSWAFEAQVRFFLCERFGSDWFARRQAGALLRELWSLGQKPTADELLADLTGAEIDLAAVVERIGEKLG
jgi:hypothetical protein